MQFNLPRRELTLKVVYYGPALSGKTTNLQSVHSMVPQGGVGRLMTLETRDDRTLFFDLLPVFFKTRSGWKVKIKLFTVPGQVIHASTRRVVLQGADAIAFIADSQLAETEANKQAFQDLRENMAVNQLPDELPLVIQFNKRDLPNVRTPEELEQIRAKSKEPVFEAVAVRGQGVIESLYGLLKLTFRNLNARHSFTEKFGLTEKDFLKNIFQHVNLEAAGVNAGEELSGLKTSPGSEV